jgi:hypothetical protein
MVAKADLQAAETTGVLRFISSSNYLTPMFVFEERTLIDSGRVELRAVAQSFS